MIDKQKNRQTNRQIDRQKDGQKDRPTGGQKPDGRTDDK